MEFTWRTKTQAFGFTPSGYTLEDYPWREDATKGIEEKPVPIQTGSTYETGERPIKGVCGANQGRIERIYYRVDGQG